MGYFSSVLAEPAAQSAGRLSLQDLLASNVAGPAIWGPLAKQLGITDWQYSGGGLNEGGNPVETLIPDVNKLSALQNYTFDWQDTGPENTGVLTVYDPAGKVYGTYNQTDQSFGSALSEWAMLAGAGFGGLGLAGFGPLSGALGGLTGAAPGGFSAGAVDSAALGLDAAGGVTGGITGGSGLTLGGSAGYGSITASPGVLGAGGAGLGGGITAPALGGSAGLGSGLGMTGVGAGVAGSFGAGGISSLLSGLGSVSGIKDLASIASGIYGMSLASDARKASDPFAPYRAAYGQKLAALEANPGLITTRPGFQAGLDTIQRKSAATGYYGSGNMASALSRYSGDFYTQEANRLAGLAGASQTPGAGQFPAADLASQSLGSIGYGLAPMLERFIRGG